MERPKHLRPDDRPRDANQLGRRIVDLAVGVAAEDRPEPNPKPRRARQCELSPNSHKP